MKNKRISCIHGIAVVLLFTFCMASAASADTATHAIKVTVDGVLETLKDKKLSLPANKEKRRAKIRGLIRDRFDFEEMARRTLATHWGKRTAQEKEDFISVFSDLLEYSYIGKIEGYTNEKVTYDKEQVKGKGKYALVKTSIVTSSVSIPIDYKLIMKKKTWLVYDVVIEGVSFISTYRSQYNKIITSESFASLMKKMKEKLVEEKKKLT